MPRNVAIVLKGYPRLSETFIAQEILALQNAGMNLQLVSLRHPTDTKTHPVHAEITAPVTYLPEYLYQEPGRVLKAWTKVRNMPGYKAAKATWLTDLKRDRTSNRGRRWGQALVLAAELPDSVEQLYAHFLHTPASVARYAAMIRQMPWSCSAHAKDIWTSPDWEKQEKLDHMDWLVTCTAYNVEHLKSLARDPETVELVYHGLDLSRFPAPESPHSDRDGTEPENPVTILSVGRAVPKKGYEYLLEALAQLPKTLNWTFTHIGGGSEAKKLKELADSLGIADRITWLGSQPQETVLEHYRKADIFALASRIVADGDRDGLPNVLVEAQSQAVACVSTKVSAIPELINNGESGLLVPPENAEGLRAALEMLITDPQLRLRLGEAGMQRVRTDFGFERGIAQLTRKFGITS